MSRGRLRPGPKPFELDGFKFGNATAAGQYEGLKSYAGRTLRTTVSTDGRMLVCEWGDGVANPRQTQVFNLAQGGKNKYNARKTAVGSIVFDSGHEARCYVDLLHQQAAGEIAELQHHPPAYEFMVNGVKIGRYTPDFTYRVVKTNKRVVADSKSAITRQAHDYPLRKKLMLACHGITVVEL